MSEVSSITSFKVAGEYFGFETMKIQHILEMTKPTHVPLSKKHFMGVINNHGNMIPVVDFRVLLGVESDVDVPEASIIIVSVDGTTETLVGFKVDEVDEVFDFSAEQFSKEVVWEVESDLQRALCATIKNKDKFVYQLNLDELAHIIEQ